MQAIIVNRVKGYTRKDSVLQERSSKAESWHTVKIPGQHRVNPLYGKSLVTFTKVSNSELKRRVLQICKTKLSLFRRG